MGGSTGRACKIFLPILVPCRISCERDIQLYIFLLKRTYLLTSSAVNASGCIYFRIMKAFCISNHGNATPRTNLHTSITPTTILFFLFTTDDDIYIYLIIRVSTYLPLIWSESTYVYPTLYLGKILV